VNRGPSSYGRVRRGRSWAMAHRFIYASLVGPINPGETIHHKCAHTLCINPAHLEPATSRANVGEMFARRALEAQVAALEALVEHQAEHIEALESLLSGGDRS
jgi:hypothetical protein